MLESLKEAAENFCVHQIGASCEIKDAPTNKRTLIAYIDVQAQDQKRYRVYIASDNDFMQKVSKLFLEEEKSDEETLKEMTLETANLIIGSAKVIAEELGISYTMGTPHFAKVGEFDFSFDERKVVHIDNAELIIAIKELDA
ncbi:chemotaxis protein CheX [Sulfurimonas sp. SWIR-19]|uniref:chemotaxis protein CheX n=1 Tax=Sulfurimonas sp. SWIR-19 TaxID=2878390 RepID=UPI001CF16A15|nr:chemotaxis protein CheX [Sulfurimonas sp. SWIR-19]UCM99287.1 chemotaxis protein CheX [Sulfurimonas sp. SWIR-19]